MQHQVKVTYCQHHDPPVEVWSGGLEVQDTSQPPDGEGSTVLETVWMVFNTSRYGLRIRSMMVGDLVEVDGVQYRCKAVGWEREPT
jgi:hypothetical protein